MFSYLIKYEQMNEMSKDNTQAAQAIKVFDGARCYATDRQKTKQRYLDCCI